jgi:hypothetical protein
MYGNSLETKFNEINSYNIFKKQIKQQILLYTIDNYHKYYIYIYSTAKPWKFLKYRCSLKDEIIYVNPILRNFSTRKIS